MAETIAPQKGVSVDAVLSMFRESAPFGDAEAAIEQDSAYAGSWIDYGPNLEPTLVIAALPGNGERLRSLAEKHTTRIRTEERNVSYQQLASEADRLVTGKPPLTSIAVDVQAGQLRVRTSNPEVTLAYLASAKPAVPFLIEDSPSLPSPASGVSGGIGLWWFNWPALPGCTSGFSLLNGAGATAILTAGHCTNTQPNPPSIPGDPDWVALGPPLNRVFAGSQDRQIHVVPPPDFAIGRFFTMWGWGQPTGRQNPILNELVCKHGIRTGTTCWSVANMNVAIPQGGFYPVAMTNLFEGNSLNTNPLFVNCNLGDSGGPIWNGNVRAVGIVEGRRGDPDVGQGTTCIGAKILLQIPSGWEIGT